MIKTVIVDDEPHCISRLERLLTTHCREEVAIVGTASSVADGIELIRRVEPFFVLLDIQINDQSGFDLLEAFPEKKFEVVCCTAYERYAIKAFKFSALDYLLKPIDRDDLVDVVARIVEKRDALNRESQLRFSAAKYNIDGYQQQRRRIAIPSLTGLTLLDVDDIVRCESDVNYTVLHLADKSTMVVAKTLKDFESLLELHGFIRLHNSHLVNVAYIKAYHKGKGGYVVLQDGREVEVSVRRKDVLLKKLNSL